MDYFLALRWKLWVTIFCFGTLPGCHVGFTPEHNTSAATRTEVSFNADGAPNGDYRQYDASGRLLTTGKFRNGKREGVWTFWDPAGSKQAEITYSDGVKEGSCRMWYGSFVFPASMGQRKLEVAFASDKQNGTKRSWWPNGNRRCETELDHGSIVSARCWSEDGDEISAAESIEFARDELRADVKLLNWVDQSITDSIERLR